MFHTGKSGGLPGELASYDGGGNNITFSYHPDNSDGPFRQFIASFTGSKKVLVHKEDKASK